MRPPAYSAEDVVSMLLMALDRPGADTGETVFTIDQIVSITKISKKTIEHDCRSGAVEHTHTGNLRGMTRAQIAAYVARYAVGGGGTPIAHDDEMAQARSASRKAAARRGPRAAA